MKQRIRTVGIIKKDDAILFLKRNLGRSEGTIVWELPTGKIELGEQPEEAMTRIIYDGVGLKVSAIKLMDVVTFLSLDESSRLANLYIIYEIEVEQNQKIELGDRYSAYKFLKDGDDKVSTRLDDASLSVLEILYGRNNENKVNRRDAINGAVVFVDGCSRGNPGPSGVGYYIVGEDGRLLKKGGEFIGFATSRVAEYFALKEGCEQAVQLGLRSVRFVNDNLMMINQMNGIYKIKNDDILPIYQDIQEILKKIDAYAFVHVKRVQNANADKEANLAVDRHFG